MLLEAGGTNLVDEIHQPPLWPTMWSTEVKGAAREYQVARLRYMEGARSAVMDSFGEESARSAE